MELVDGHTTSAAPTVFYFLGTVSAAADLKGSGVPPHYATDGYLPFCQPNCKVQVDSVPPVRSCPYNARHQNGACFMGTPLKNPPVYLVLTQVQFNQLMVLEDHLKAIQESFRNAGYPDFERHQFTFVQLPGEEGGVPQPIQQDFYQFGNQERSCTFLLNSYGLVLQSSSYDHFDAFRTSFLEGVERVHQVVKLNFIEKVGLRYLDRVMPASDETLDIYLQLAARGLPSISGAARQHAYMEALHQLGQIQLTSRVIIQADGKLTLPADIHTFNMRLEERFTAYHGPSATLDNDAFFSERESYDADKLEKRMHDLHDVIDGAFYSIVTDEAIRRWR